MKHSKKEGFFGASKSKILEERDGKKIALSEKEIEKTKKYSIVEGSFYHVMYGFGEQYIVPFALKLGASASQVAILSSVPYFLGSISQLIGAKLTDIYKKRKNLITMAVILQALIWLPIFFYLLLQKIFFC